MSLLKRARSKGSESKALRGETLPFAIESTYDFTHTLEGDWPDVCGYVCFKIWDEYTNKDMYVCIIGLDTVALGNNEYASRGWDKQVFWMDIGADAPLFVCGIYAPNYVEEGVECDNVFWAPNITYRDPETEEVYWTDLWMYLDDEDEVEEAWIVLYDEDGEEIDEWELEEGDAITSFAPAFLLDYPDDICSATIERDFQVVRKEPVFFYAHMTPNIDFPNPLTKDKIDFDDLDLFYILRGEREGANGVVQSVFSTAKKIGFKWGDKTSHTENWFIQGASSMLRFFTPDRWNR